MTSFSPSFHGPFLGLAVLALAGATGLRASDWSALTTNTPFGQAPASASGATGDLEFRGVVQEDDGYLINLYNPTSKTSQWVAVNGKMPGLEVKSYDAAGEKVQITQGGRPLTLQLKQAKVALLAAPAAAAADKGGPGGPDGISDDRRAEIRAMMRAREGGGEGGPGAFMRNMPPEAQAMIEEFRRRRAESGAGPQPAAASGDQSQAQPTQGQGQNRRQRQQR